MKLSTLQSLIDRTSNQIAEYEEAIKYCNEMLDYPENDLTCEVARKHKAHWRRKLKPLRVLQRELKDEVAYLVSSERMINRAFSVEVVYE